MQQRIFVSLCAAIMAMMTMMACAGAAAGTLEEVKKKGVLVVGVKTDYPPWGSRDQAGKVVGMEPDMAADLAKRLGVKLEMVPVLSSNRMQFLQQGRIDVMIATMSINDERRKAVGVVEPLYYASGVAMLARKSAKIQGLAQLKGRKICALQGAYYNREVSERWVQGELVAFRGVTEGEQATLSGQCEAFLYDDAILIFKKASEPDKWRDFDLVAIPEIAPLPWGIAVRTEDRDAEWGKYVSGVIVNWHRSGLLMELEKKWLGANTPWLTEVNAKAGK
jgi:polar amino acid transport system substrate-binding protein